jgi:hypothetical protein
MLKLKKILAPVNIDLELDYYVPIKVKFKSLDQTDGATFYCEIKHPQTAFMEIGIDIVIGTILLITLVSPPPIKTGWHETPFKPQNIIHGLPAFQTKEWKNKTHLDIVNNFDVYLEKNTLIFVFPQDKMEIKTKIINDRIIFGFNEKKLLSTIEVNDLNTEEIASLKESFEGSNSKKS